MEVARPDWILAMSVDDLIEKRKAIVRHNGKQIALFATQDGFYACNNRCPHQGYPLVEGSVDQDCVLTCNWHNWKFDLANGRNLYGGDKLRTYPVKVEEGALYLDVAEAPFETRYETALENLRSAVRDNSYDRIARELSRIQNMGGRLDTTGSQIDFVEPYPLRVRLDSCLCGSRGLVAVG